MMAQANVKKVIKKEWMDRIWTGNRAPKDNLTEEGLKYRKQSNICAVAGMIVLVMYVLLISPN